MRRCGPDISCVAHLIVCVSRLSWRTAVERTSMSVRLAAAASSWPRCSVRFWKWASFVSLHQHTHTHAHTPSTLSVLEVPLHLTSLVLLTISSQWAYRQWENSSSVTALSTEMHIPMCTKIQTSTHILTWTHIPSLLRWKQPLCSVTVLLGVHYLVMHLAPIEPLSA